MSVATRSSWARRSRSAASAACSRTSCGDADGGRGLGREGRQQAAIVGRVVLLREPRTEVERADQLTLRTSGTTRATPGVAQRVDAPGTCSSSRATSTGPGADWR